MEFLLTAVGYIVFLVGGLFFHKFLYVPRQSLMSWLCPVMNFLRTALGLLVCAPPPPPRLRAEPFPKVMASSFAASRHLLSKPDPSLVCFKWSQGIRT